MAEKNAAGLKKFIVNNKAGKAKILVMPFYNSNAKIDEYGEKICRSLVAELQKELGSAYIVMQPGEFKKEEANKALSATKIIEGDENEYYKAYYKRMDPDYYIEGYFLISDVSGKKKIVLNNVSCKTNPLHNWETLAKFPFEGHYDAWLTALDESDIKTGNYYGEGRGTTVESARNKVMEAMLNNISSALEARFYGLKSSDDEDVKELSKTIISTYSGRALAISGEKLISDEPGRPSLHDI
ncbi:MAG: hypothetical protein BWY70_01315 [Bacteroidetes bacterium ADurb.Bin408]|nr:MAG: hypothetical protein BWY70_01315 [Bacteroidetes bacterium ADurb.Bin408]